MASFPPITMTTEGLNMIAKASSGNIEDRLIITKVKLGDGISTGNIRDYTDVISSKKEVTLSNWENRGDGRFRYTFVYNNEGVKIGFYHREIGLFAKSGNDGAEKLIAYTNAGSYPGYIDDETNKIPYQSLMINIGVGDTDNVSGEVDVSNAITIEMLNEHKNDENAHSNLIKSIFGIEEATEGNIKEKIEEYAKKVCLPLSGGIMEGLVSLFTGSTISTPTQQDNSKKITNTEWVQTWVKAFVSELSANIEVETQSDGHFSCPALGITGLMAQNGYICLGKLFGNLILQWGLGNTPNTVFYPIPFARLIFGLVANDVGNGNSAIGCTKSNLNAFFPTATNGNGVGFTYIVIGF